MPQMAEEILKRNEQAKGDDSSPPPINFVGFLVGNPYTDASSNQVQLEPVCAPVVWRVGFKYCTTNRPIKALIRLSLAVE